MLSLQEHLWHFVTPDQSVGLLLDESTVRGMTQQQAEHSHLQLTSSMINSSQITSTDLRVGSWHRSMHLLQQQGRHLQEASSQHKQSSLKHDHHDCPCTVRCRRGWHLTLTGLHGCNSSRANRKSTQVQLMLKTTNALCNVSADDCLCFVHHRRSRQFRLTGLHSCSSKAGNYRTHRLQFTPKPSHILTDISLVDCQRLSVHCALQEGLASQADRLAQLQQQGRQLQEPLAAAHTQDDKNLRTQRHTVAAAEEEVCNVPCIASSSASCLTFLDPMHVHKEGISGKISKAKLEMENKFKLGGDSDLKN